MADLHMEGLSDEDLVEYVDQALASLRVRYGGDDPEGAAERFDAEARVIEDEITAVCDSWDVVVARFRS